MRWDGAVVTDRYEFVEPLISIFRDSAWVVLGRRTGNRFAADEHAAQGGADRTSNSPRSLNAAAAAGVQKPAVPIQTRLPRQDGFELR